LAILKSLLSDENLSSNQLIYLIRLNVTTWFHILLNILDKMVKIPSISWERWRKLFLCKKNLIVWWELKSSQLKFWIWMNVNHTILYLNKFFSKISLYSLDIMREMEETLSILEKFALRREFVFMSAHLFDFNECYQHNSIFWQIF
jgi:hypothetical protein